jgi:2'-5' RNA ligase
VRLFVAVTPPAEVLDDLDAAVTAARAGRGDRRDLRWTGPEDWHVTLAFLGEVPGPVAERLAPQLEQAAAGAEPFPLALAGAGAFPAPVRARVLWCGLGGDRSALAALAAAVAAATTRAGAAPPDDGRPFSPHLTLAYYPRPPADAGDLVTVLGAYAGPAWLVDGIQLIESRTGRRPRYRTVGRWPLNGDTLNR